MRDTPLTSDERARLPEFITHWARIGLSAQPIEHSAAERAIAALYAWAGAKRIIPSGRPPLSTWRTTTKGRDPGRAGKRGQPAQRCSDCSEA